MSHTFKVVNSTPGKLVRGGLQGLLDSYLPGVGTASGVLLDKFLQHESDSDSVPASVIDTIIARKLFQDFESFVAADCPRLLSYRKLAQDRFVQLRLGKEAEFKQFLASETLLEPKNQITTPHSVASQN